MNYQLSLSKKMQASSSKGYYKTSPRDTTLVGEAAGNKALIQTSPHNALFSPNNADYSKFELIDQVQTNRQVKGFYVAIKPSITQTYWYLDRVLELRKLEKLSSNWHEDGVEPPNRTATYWADVALDILRVDDFACDRVLASVDEGIGICFVREPKYADIEIFNTGEILAVTSERNSSPKIWEVHQSVEGIRQALEEIREYLEL